MLAWHRNPAVRAGEPLRDAAEHHRVEHERVPRREMGVERRVLDLRSGHQLLSNLVPVLSGKNVCECARFSRFCFLNLNRISMTLRSHTMTLS